MKTEVGGSQSLENHHSISAQTVMGDARVIVEDSSQSRKVLRNDHSCLALHFFCMLKMESIFLIEGAGQTYPSSS